MADRYIDDDETRLYGDYALEQIALHLVGRVREFDPALQFATAALGSATELVAAHLYAARSADPALHAALSRRERVIADARSALLRFGHHLEAHRPGAVPYGAFFVEASNTLARRGPWRLVAALDHVLGSLDEFEGLVREAGYWRDELNTVQQRLREVIADDRAVRANTVRSEALSLARRQWLVRYESAKHLVAALLGFSGSALGLDEIFDDLADVHHAEGVVEDEAPPPPSDAPDAPLEL
ncbi:MAG: hypothetical protein JNK72_03675 [Myxococcales bacterium]|nr:hypothetical protein [Myxococcales bacterium]